MTTRKTKLKWDLRMLDLARLVGGWSKDPSTQVGAVISDSMNRVIGLGYNGFPRNVRDDPTVTREEKLLRTIHAEVNAILNATREVTGCTIYVTAPPCARCAAVITQVGIKEVVCLPASPAFKERWAADIANAEDTFKQAGVILTVKEYV